MWNQTKLLATLMALKVIWRYPELVSGTSPWGIARRTRVAYMTLALADDAVLHNNAERLDWLSELMWDKIGVYANGSDAPPDVFNLSEYLSLLEESLGGSSPSAEDAGFLRSYREEIDRSLEKGLRVRR